MQLRAKNTSNIVLCCRCEIIKIKNFLDFLNEKKRLYHKEETLLLFIYLFMG